MKTERKGEFKMINIIESGVNGLRDPFVLVENGKYYMYGSGWIAYKSDGDLRNWEKIQSDLVVVPDNYEKNKWAPEVHKYKGKFYMFTTYFSSQTNHRGCTIMESDSPEGVFREITNGHITPHDWNCIDGTLYIDEKEHPWMVFVHEWTCTDDGVGRMAAARLSDDLTHFISEPIELFRADSPAWTNDRVTDGCFMYRTAEGRLLMIWSNFDSSGNYCVGVAHSKNGKMDGEWVQEQRLFFKELSGKHDGGHGMIFMGLNGQKYLSVHSPNTPTEDGRKEQPIFIPVAEKNGTLVCEETDLPQL